MLARSRGSDLQAPAGGIQGHLGKTHVCNRGGHLLASRCKKPLHVRTPVPVSRDSWASLVVQRRSMIVPVCHTRWVGVDCGETPERGSLHQPGRQSQDDPRSSTRSRSHHCTGRLGSWRVGHSIGGVATRRTTAQVARGQGFWGGLWKQFFFWIQKENVDKNLKTSHKIQK